MEIVNIVATAKLAFPVDLEEIKKALPGSEFTSGGGKWLKFRLMPGNHYIAFYRSGKFLICGPNSQEAINEISRRIISLLKNSSIDQQIVKIEVHNIVVKDKVRLEQSLEELAVMLDLGKTTYEPEQFPALVYKDWGVSVLLFSSGQFIMAGIKKENDIEALVEKFKRLIQSMQ